MDDLSDELRELAAWLETPPAPDVAAAVRARLSAPPRRRSWWRRWRYHLAGTIAALLVVVLLPPARGAVADAVGGLLRYAGITVERVSAPPSPLPVLPSPLPGQLITTVAEAGRLVNFGLPRVARLGEPDRVLLADPDEEGHYRLASLSYRGGSVRLDAVDGQLDPIFQKTVVGANGDWVRVRDDYGVWLSVPHELTYVDRRGRTRTESARLAGPTLIWSGRLITYRLEGVLTQAEAIEVAESIG